MKNRRVVLAITLFVVAVLNIWHWWPANEKATTTTRRPVGNAFQATDFEIQGARPVTEARTAAVGRDLFRIKEPVRVARKGPPPPPPKTPEQLEREAAQSELSNLRLIAVAAHGRNYEAFMSAGGEEQLVRAGARIGARFIVQQISADAVQVSDPQTSVSGVVALTGR